MELKEIHALIKEHPYRIYKDEKYLTSYKKLLNKLGDIFYKELENSKYKIARNMLHDFYRDINNLGRGWKYQSESDLHVENCISTIHDFIDTGKVLSWWDGVGELFHSVGRYIKYSWDDEKNKYYPDIPIEKIPALIKDLTFHVNMMETDLKSHPDSVIYSKEIIDYWKEMIEYLKKKGK